MGSDKNDSHYYAYLKNSKSLFNVRVEGTRKNEYNKSV